MIYPTDIYDEQGHGRIHEGHGLSQDEIRADLDCAASPRQPYALAIDEVWLRYHNRIKWCERIDGVGCDMNGEWHGHWSPVQPGTNGCAFTIVHPANEPTLVVH